MQQNPGACDIFIALNGAIICLAWKSQWGLVYRQSSNGLAIHRQPSKNVIFNIQPSKMQFKINRQKGVSNLTISADLDGFPAPKEFLNWKNLFSCPKTLFLDHTVPYKLLISKNILKFCKWKAKKTSKTHQLILKLKTINCKSYHPIDMGFIDRGIPVMNRYFQVLLLYHDKLSISSILNLWNKGTRDCE